MNPFDDPAWDEFVAQVRTDALEKIAGSAAMISIAPGDDLDIKFAVELGIGIMLDKPLLVIALPGRPVPERLRRAADEVVYADIDVEEGRQAVQAALERMGLA